MEYTDKANEEISIWLDRYDEMFSDFDPRPYSKRTVSDDFVLQLRKVAKDRYGKKMTLKLLLPDSVRNLPDEAVISQRMRDYFRQTYDQLLLERKAANRKGLLLTITGILLMILAGYISFRNSNTFYAHALRILFEPAGWFMLWLGLDHLVYFPGKSKKDLYFYSHMAQTNIEFSTYSIQSKNELN